MPKFNHAYDFAFEVISNDEDASDVTPHMIREALIKRATNIPDQEITEACNNYDTHQEEEITDVNLS
jgi:hypothetical protein